MNRQRYIIAVLCFMAALICTLIMIFLPELDPVTVMILLFITISTVVGFIFMLVDCGVFSKCKNKRKV